MAERAAHTSRWRQHAPLLILLLVNLVLGLLVFDNYGESWDENSIYLYAQNSSDAYRTLVTDEDLRPRHTGPFNLRFYGPAFFMFSHHFAAISGSLFPGLHSVDLWHFSYFIAFLVALVGIYFLCLRVMSRRAALLATLFFNTQPLLWGHAFINPKDIPFMAFFTLALVLGLYMSDAVEERLSRKADGRRQPPPVTWGSVDPRRRWVLAAVALVWVAIVVIVYKLSVDFRLQYSVWGMRAAFSLLGLLGLVLLARWLLPQAALAAWKKARIFHQRHIPPIVYAAGLVLGYAVAIRIIAPAAAGMVAIFLLARVGRRALPALTVYFSIATVVSFTLWPFLWQAPLASVLESVQQMANFPKDVGVLFAGIDYRSGELPWQYFPRLLSAQLTLPLLGLAAAGFALFLRRRRELEMKQVAQLYLIAVWFLLPAAGLVLLRPTMYDNFRQFLFLLPPLFVFCGLAVEWLLTRLSALPAYPLLALFLLPGLIGIISLHPYEYTYFNATAGPRAGLEERFDTDYWATAYRQAINYLNENAEQDAAVFAYGPDHMLRHFGRADLVAVYEQLSQQTDTSHYDYAILSTRFGQHQRLFPEGQVIYEVMRADTLFAVIKRVNILP